MLKFCVHNRFSYTCSKFQVVWLSICREIYWQIKTTDRQKDKRYHTRVYNPNTWAKNDWDWMAHTRQSFVVFFFNYGDNSEAPRDLKEIQLVYVILESDHKLDDRFSPGIGVIDPCMISVSVCASCDFYLTMNISHSIKWIDFKFWTVLAKAIEQSQLQPPKSNVNMLAL